MIYDAVYAGRDNAVISTVTFDAADLTEALRVVCETQVTPEGAEAITIAPQEGVQRDRR
jgi:hypothetical protein